MSVDRGPPPPPSPSPRRKEREKENKKEIQRGSTNGKKCSTAWKRRLIRFRRVVYICFLIEPSARVTFTRASPRRDRVWSFFPHANRASLKKKEGLTGEKRHVTSRERTKTANMVNYSRDLLISCSSPEESVSFFLNIKTQGFFVQLMVPI